jgi:crotonobetainyl-CoA:carnitine CoA-transferase CaiB-like acyl-CoA transferase
MRALDGLTVLDLGQVYMGPYCGLLLQRLGADVIKIEPPQGDSVRSRAVGDTETTAFSLLNAGKRSVCLDLKDPADQAHLRTLARSADVVIENSAPGVAARLGITYDALATENPRIILASGRGYAPEGPNADLKAMDLTVQAMSGLLSVTGFPSGAPVKAGAAVADFLAGAHLAAAVLAALVQRGVTGRGQWVQVTMEDAIMPALTSNLAGYLDSDGLIQERTGNRHGGMAVAPYNVYPASNGWVAILALTDRHWQKLAEVIGRPDLAAPDTFGTARQRVLGMDAVDAAVGAWSESRTTADVHSAVQAAGLPSAPVRTLAEVVADARAHGGILRTLDGDSHEQWIFGSPLRLGDSPESTPERAPRLGEHTRAVLDESQTNRLSAGAAPSAPLASN